MFISFNSASFHILYSCIFKEILREEIKILEEKVEHHPDVTRFAMENLQLRGLALIYFKVSLKRSFC
jgi:hypothetical protein